MDRLSWGWTLFVIAVILLVLYAAWDFAWVQFIHSDAVDNPRP